MLRTKVVALAVVFLATTNALAGTLTGELRSSVASQPETVLPIYLTDPPSGNIYSDILSESSYFDSALLGYHNVKVLDAYTYLLARTIDSNLGGVVANATASGSGVLVANFPYDSIPVPLSRDDASASVSVQHRSKWMITDGAGHPLSGSGSFKLGIGRVGFWGGHFSHPYFGPLGNLPPGDGTARVEGSAVVRAASSDAITVISFEESRQYGDGIRFFEPLSGSIDYQVEVGDLSVPFDIKVDIASSAQFKGVVYTQGYFAVVTNSVVGVVLLDYSEPTGDIPSDFMLMEVPEPSSLVLLVCGGLAMLQRSR